MVTKWLKVEIFPNIYRRFLISEKLLIGRDHDCDVVMSEISVSAHHATIWTHGDETWIKDQGSTNGTSVNEVLIQERLLHDRDHLGIGYAHAYYTVERETTPDFILDLGSEKIPTASDLVNYRNIDFIFPCRNENIQAVCKCFREKLAKMPDSEYFVASLSRTLNNLFEKKGAKAAETTIECQFRQCKAKLSFTIIDKTSDNTCKTLAPDGDTHAEDDLLNRGIDVIEYGDNIVVLTKYLQNMPKQAVEKKYLVHRHYSTMLVNSSFSADIALTDKKIASFPDFGTMPLRSAQNSDFVQVVPVFPGCLCVPPALDMNLREGLAHCRFWITPLVAGKANGYFQILRNGQICQHLQVSYLATGRKLADRFLAMAFWLPALLILAGIFKFPLKEKMPALSAKLFLFVDFLGGLSGLAVFLGSLSLCVALALYLRNRPVKSSLVYETVDM